MSDYDYKRFSFPPLLRLVQRIVGTTDLGVSTRAALEAALLDPERLERIDLLRSAFDKLVAPHAAMISMFERSAARFRTSPVPPEGDTFDIYGLREPAFVEGLLQLLGGLRNGTKARDEFSRLALVIDPVTAAVVVGHRRAVRHADLLSQLALDPDASRSRFITADVSLKSDEDSIFLNALRHDVSMTDEEWGAVARMLYESEGMQRYVREFSIYQSSFSALLTSTPRSEGERLLFRDTLRTYAEGVVEEIPSSDSTLPIWIVPKAQESPENVGAVAGEEDKESDPSRGGSGKGGAAPATPAGGAAPISSPESGPISSAAPFGGSALDRAEEEMLLTAGAVPFTPDAVSAEAAETQIVSGTEVLYPLLFARAAGGPRAFF
jgi:hypothetical protein